MRIYPEQLAAKLHQSLAPSYLLFGNESLLKQEALQQLLAAANAQGFTEKHRFEVSAQFNWDDVFACCQSLSLFASRQVLILSLADSAPTLTVQTQLKTLDTLLHPDILLIINGPKLNKQQESSKWFTQLTRQGTYVVCNYPEQPEQLRRFIAQRCGQLGLAADAASIDLLAKLHEGNLLALTQSLQLLQLLFADGKLTLARLEQSLSSHHHFTPFQLIDALLAAKPKRALRILAQLEAEEVEITLLLRLVQKEIVQLYTLQERLRAGGSLNALFEQFRIWQSRRPLILSALQRLPLPQLATILSQLKHLELQAKTAFDDRSYQNMQTLCMEICGKPLHLVAISQFC